ncbi:MAG TPA: DDE-type integrase/transposase/recombinase [Candidatus Nanoarchaeia archaeon]|nr:DDE-type integrase/transposase/recombinase [Candidatus Nanoarchaeia archaeon]
MKYNNAKQTEVKKICCPNCNSNKTKKRGLRQTENRGKIQRYFCNNCKTSFVLDDGFFRMRNNPQKITLSMDLFYRGVSTRKVQEHLSAFYPHNADHRTILRWIVKYAKMIHSFTNKLKINCGKEIQIDEMEYKTKGKKSWFIDSIDTTTRFMVASEYTKTREQKELKSILQTAKQKTGNQIKIVTSDGFTAYKKAIKKVFGYNNKLGKYNVIHNKVTQLKNEGFNHKIERLHNNIRQRTKTFRGFKNIDSANAIMKGFEVFYNFIMKHQALNKCPYELATDLKLENLNKWLELIQISKKA